MDLEETKKRWPAVISSKFPHTDYITLLHRAHDDIRTLITELEEVKKERDKIYAELPIDWARIKSPGELPGLIAKLTGTRHAYKQSWHHTLALLAQSRKELKAANKKTEELETRVATLYAEAMTSCRKLMAERDKLEDENKELRNA